MSSRSNSPEGAAPMEALQRLLLDSAARLFSAGSEVEAQEALEKGIFPQSLWTEIDQNGLLDALVREDQGGSEVSHSVALSLSRVAGAFALPLPIEETLLGRFLLSEGGIELTDSGLKGQPLALIPVPMGAPLSTRVRWPKQSRVLMVVEHGADHSMVLAELPAQELRNSAGEPSVRLTTQELLGVLDGAEGVESPMSAPAVLAWLAAAKTQRIAGTMERILDLTMEHAKGREQFGRTIAKFQAVQHLVAQLAAEVASVGVAADAAAAALDEGGAEGFFAVAAAKARASESATEVARIAHQVHGAIGYTREHALHRFTRRLWDLRDESGDETFWNHQVGGAALEASGSGLWDLLAN